MGCATQAVWLSEGVDLRVFPGVRRSRAGITTSIRGVLQNARSSNVTAPAVRARRQSQKPFATRTSILLCPIDEFEVKIDLPGARDMLPFLLPVTKRLRSRKVHLCGDAAGQRGIWAQLEYAGLPSHTPSISVAHAMLMCTS